MLWWDVVFGKNYIYTKEFVRSIKTEFLETMLNEEDYPSDEETSDEEYMPSGKHQLVVFTQTIKNNQQDER